MHATCTKERNTHHGAADKQASQVSPLPQGWTELIDENSTLPYWLNTADGATTWDRPTAPATIIAVDAAECREAQPLDITIENAGLNTCPLCKRNIDDHTDSELQGCLEREQSEQRATAFAEGAERNIAERLGKDSHFRDRLI
jgi:hypothetical protein